MMDFRRAASIAEAGDELSADQMSALVAALLDQSAADPEPAEGAVGAARLEGDQEVQRWLIALSRKGESAGELVGAARALRGRMIPIRNPRVASLSPEHRREILLDTCGTGGSKTGTFNISTATAIVVSAAGIPVAKHGNRRATSRSGSADVLAELGVEIEAERAVVERSLAEIGLCFCYAPRLHPAMRHVAQLRRSIATPTIFNLLGPLCNPAGATHQLLGTPMGEKQPILAAALAELGTERAFIVRGLDGQDEVTLDGITEVHEVTVEGGIAVHRWSPEMFGLSPVSLTAIQAAGPPQSAAIIRDLLRGDLGPCRDIVLANAAAAFLLVHRVHDLREGVQLAAETIDSGSAARQLDRLRLLQKSVNPTPHEGT